MSSRIKTDNGKSLILVVDDNDINLTILCDFLKRNNYNVITAQDSDSACNLAIQSIPDLILLDVMMPDVDGFETCWKLKNLNEVKDTPIIFMTALADLDSKIKGFKAGGVDYITKPFQNEEILARVKLHLSLREMHRLLEIKNSQLQKEIKRRIKKEEALKESEKHYRLLTETSPDIIVIHSIGIIQYINTLGSELLEEPQEEIIGTFFLNYIHPDCREDVIARNKNIFIEGKENRFYEEKLITKSGKEYYIESAFSPFTLYNKNAVLVVGRDITNRKKAEIALKESEERFKTLVQNINGYIYSVNYDKGKVVSSYHSPQCASITGYTPEEYRTDPDLWIKMVYKDDKIWVQNFFIDLTENLKQTHIEHRIIHKDGSVKWISNIFSIRINEQKEIIHLYGFIFDITDRKMAEKALNEQYYFLQKLIDSIPNPIFYKLPDGIFQGCNNAYEKYIGASKENIIGKKIHNLLPREIADIHNQMDLKLFENPGVQVYEIHSKSSAGTDKDLLINKATFHNADGSLGGIVGVIMEITQQKQAEEKLRSALDQLIEMESIINKGPAVVFLWRAEEGWPIEFVSNNIRQYGYLPEDFIVDKLLYLNIIHKDDILRIKDEVKFYSEQKINEFIQEYRIIGRNGKLFWVNDHTWTRRTEAGEITHFQGIVIDITYRKNAEQLLKESEERYRTLAENSYDLISELSSNSKFLYVSPNVDEILGYMPEEIINKSIFEFIHPDDIPAVLTELKKDSGRVTLRYKHKNGSWRWFESAGKKIHVENGEKRGVIVSRDITDRKKLEQQLIQTEKLMAVGEMSAMIAHEFRNALTSVKMILQLTSESENISHSEKKSFGIAINSIYHMENVVQQLLNFSLPAPAIFQDHNINDVIDDCLPFIKMQAKKKDISIIKKFDNSIPPVFVSASGIKEAIINLLMNATQAYDDSSVKLYRKILVSTRRIVLPESLYDTNFHYKHNKYDDDKSIAHSEIQLQKGTCCAFIEIKDNGSGIDSSFISRIFEPFFTTKEKGTGLGLSIVKRTVDSHGGIIRVESSPSIGTSFKIFLPVNTKKT